MANTHTIQCACGELRGVLTATKPSNHCVCYCRDCRAFVRHLGALDALDAGGGAEIIHVPAPNVRFTRGAEKLACLRLTDRGMVRWYASCCRTPIGNTPADRRVAFVGLSSACLSHGAQTAEESFGPVTMVVNVQSATGGATPKEASLWRGIAKVAAIIARARLTGSYRASPFFDARTGEPVVRPSVLTPEELATAKRVG